MVQCLPGSGKQRHKFRCLYGILAAQSQELYWVLLLVNEKPIKVDFSSWHNSQFTDFWFDTTAVKDRYGKTSARERKSVLL